jgi:inosine-uridine nucleoside N-ribohydrolase
MKRLSYLILVSYLLWSCTNLNIKEADNPVRIIFDTDLGSDYDDVGALAFLHAMADSGKADILATVCSNKYELAAPSIEIINTYFGRPKLAIGSPKTEGVNDMTPYHWTDTLVARYPHSIKLTSDAQDAVAVYRKILNEQDSKSVTIVTVGYLTNLCNLLKSQPDKISDLSGIDLITKKVKKLITMGGIFPEGGRSFNIFMDSVASEYVFKHWPGEIIFTGDDIGQEIRTGLKLINSDIKNSPVKDAYKISIPLSEGDKNGRMSWDQTAVLIAIYGTEGFFDTVRGEITVNKDGSNLWVNDLKGNHKYVIQKMSANKMSAFIEERMMHIPDIK